MKKKDKIDCCFLIPNNAKKSYQKLSETYSAIEPPTWALLLAQSMASNDRVPQSTVKTTLTFFSINSLKPFIEGP